MPTLEIDGKQVTVEAGVNVIQAAERAGIEIPHYCYHPALPVAGNCRMCLVEIEKMPKLQIACNTRVAEGMVVRTQTERVQQARQSVLEFLLINHPIDCPICDQAGECKLQDYYMDYGRHGSSMPLEGKVHKRKAMDIGRMVMLDQERCILCTRCTRFLDEVTKTGELGIFERGDRSAVDLFPGRRLDNPYSGNVVDICPVGALTNKDFRFRSRVWYLDHTPSVCASCATGCNIEIHHRRGEVFRFRPRHNRWVNGYWMCDEGRLSYKRLQGEGRLSRPAVREGDRWVSRGWEDVLGEVGKRLRGIAEEKGEGAVAGIVSAQATNEEAYLFARLVRDMLHGRIAGLSWSPPDAFRDELLIDADKNPNTAGLLALGIPLEADAILDDAAAGRVEALLLLRADIAPARGGKLVEELARRVGLVVILDTHYHATAAAGHVLLPIATFAETDGTFVSRGGRVQRIRQSVAPPGGVRTGWSLLAGVLGGELRPDAASVFGELGDSAPAFRRLTYDAIGSAGAPLEAPAAD